MSVNVSSCSVVFPRLLIWAVVICMPSCSRDWGQFEVNDAGARPSVDAEPIVEEPLDDASAEDTDSSVLLSDAAVAPSDRLDRSVGAGPEDACYRTTSGEGAGACAEPCSAGPCGSIQDGIACSKHEQCASAHCVDGVCCEAEACSTCLTCNGASPGRCTPVPSQRSDPHGRCVASTSTCTLATCNGSGACAAVGLGTTCSGQCSTGASSGARSVSATLERSVCDGVTSGVCGKSEVLTDCAGAVCASATACVTGCVSVHDCTLGNACNTGNGRCLAFDPGGILLPGDLKVADVVVLALPSGVIIVDVDRGVISSGTTVFRAANTDFTARELRSGIAYQCYRPGLLMA
jgi:hypothetical protein